MFPAVPVEWKDTSFDNVRVPGAFLISARRENGVMTSLKIKSLNGGTLKLKNADNAPVVQL